MSANQNTRISDRLPESLEDYGKAAIWVPLIIGSAILVGIFMLWTAHREKIQRAEMSQAEIEARKELRAAYLEMRAFRPDLALVKADRADALIHSFKADHPSQYANLRVAILLVKGESLFMQDCSGNGETAEQAFDQAIGIMTYASGDMWQFGMLGRARTKFEQGKYREALTDLDQIMDRNPSYGAAYYWRSLTRAAMDDEKGAQEDENRARALDSWPPLRDFMQASCVWTRDIISNPENHPSPIIVDPEERSLVPYFAPSSQAGEVLQPK